MIYKGLTSSYYIFIPDLSNGWSSASFSSSSIFRHFYLERPLNILSLNIITARLIIILTILRITDSILLYSEKCLKAYTSKAIAPTEKTIGPKNPNFIISFVSSLEIE
jgi:hypothetical protein